MQVSVYAEVILSTDEKGTMKGKWFKATFFFSFTEKSIIADINYTDCSNQVGHLKSVLSQLFPCTLLWLCASIGAHSEWKNLQSSFKDNILATFWLLCGKKHRGKRTEAEVSTQNQYCNNYFMESCWRIKEESGSHHLKKHTTLHVPSDGSVLYSSTSGTPIYDIRHWPNFPTASMASPKKPSPVLQWAASVQWPGALWSSVTLVINWVSLLGLVWF